MSRSRTGAVLGLAVVMATLGTTALCGLVLCGAHAAPAACHASQSGAVRLSDCCAAHSSAATTQAIALEALSLVRVAVPIATPAQAQPELAAAMPAESEPVRGTPVALFTLHQSLLL